MVIFVGLTGNIACGKSTVTRHWQQQHGCIVLDTDKLGADALAPGSPGFKQVLDTFSEHRHDLVLPDGTLNRRHLGQIVFADRDKKRLLERIVWPKVYGALFKGLLRSVFIGFFRSDYMVVVEIPQLFEAGTFTKLFDAIVVVSCEPKEEQLARLLRRNPDMAESDALNRLSSQMPQSEKRRLANHVVDNSGTREKSADQADVILKRIKQSYITQRRYRLTIFAIAALLIATVWYNLK